VQAKNHEKKRKIENDVLKCCSQTLY